MKWTNSYILTLLGLVILAIMAWRGTDTSGNVVVLIGAYVASRAQTSGNNTFPSLGISAGRNARLGGGDFRGG
jgi:hypothetical protein